MLGTTHFDTRLCAVWILMCRDSVSEIAMGHPRIKGALKRATREIRRFVTFTIRTASEREGCMMIQGGNRCLVTELSLFAGHSSEEITFGGFSRKLTKGEQEVLFMCVAYSCSFYWVSEYPFLLCFELVCWNAERLLVFVFLCLLLGPFSSSFFPPFFILILYIYTVKWNDRCVAFGM